MVWTVNSAGCRKLQCVVGGFCAMCVSGQFYIIGNVGTYLESYLLERGDYPRDAHWFMSTLIALVFAGSQVGTILGGYLTRLLHPHLISLIGLSLLTAGVAVSYWTVRVSTVWVIVTFVGIPSVGVGCVYGCPYSALNKHKFKNQGLVYGIVNSGFGGGAVLYNVIMSAFINPNNTAPDTARQEARYFSQSAILDRVPYSFLLLSGLYALFLPVAVWGMRPPPFPSSEESYDDASLSDSTSASSDTEKLWLKGESRSVSNGKAVYKTYDTLRSQDPVAQTITETDEEGRKSEEDHKRREREGRTEGKGGRGLLPKELFHHRPFYVLWILICLCSMSCNSCIGYYKELGQTQIQNDILLASLGTVGALVNAMGRPLWGLLVDFISFKTATVVHLSATCVFLAFWTLALQVSPWLYYLWTVLLYAAVSAFPVYLVVACRGYFGQQHQMGNLAVIWTALSGSSCLLPVISSSILSLYGWNGLVLFFAVEAFLGVLVALLLPTRLVLVTDLPKSDHLTCPCC